MVLDYLKDTKQIEGMEDLANRLKIRRETLTNWAMGQIEIDQLVKFAFSHLYEIREEFWDAPADARLEDYLGKRQQADSLRNEQRRALIQSLQEKAAVFEQEAAALARLE